MYAYILELIVPLDFKAELSHHYEKNVYFPVPKDIQAISVLLH